MNNFRFEGEYTELEILQLHAYVDGELDEAEVRVWKARLESNSRLQAECAQLLAIKRRLRSIAEEARLREHTDEVFSECMRAVIRDDLARRTDQIVGKFRYALAAGVACLVVGAAVLNWNGTPGMRGASFADTLRASASGGTDVPSLEAAWGWLRRVLRADVAPPRLRLADLQPVRVEVLRSEVDCARIVFQDRRGDRYVFWFVGGLVPYDGEPVKGAPGFTCASYGALNLICWTDGRFTYALAGPREPVDLAAMLE
jgi:hypothetical protein